MVLQAYIDDSHDDNGAYVLAGYVARAEQWAAFAKEWEELLPNTYIGKSGRHRFKMTEMAHRMELVPLFSRIIDENVHYSFNVMLRSSELERAKSRIWSDNVQIVWYPSMHISNLLVRLLLFRFYDVVSGDDRVRNWMLPEEKIDVYFDNDLAVDWILDDWEAVTLGAASSSQRRFRGKTKDG